AAADYVENRPSLVRECGDTGPAQLALVHPRKYLEMAAGLRQVLDSATSTAEDIAALVPAGETFILIDQGELVSAIPPGRCALPFPERDGRYWGKPPDSATALAECERLRRRGAAFVAFAWPAFWWLDGYAEFGRRLRARAPCVLHNERLIVFDLRSSGPLTTPP